MRIINARDGEAVERNFAARRPGFAVEQAAAEQARVMRGYIKPPVNLRIATSDTAQFTPVATAYAALYMG